MTGAGYINKRPGVNQIQSYLFNAETSSSAVGGESSARVVSCESNGRSISPSVSSVISHKPQPLKYYVLYILSSTIAEPIRVAK